MKKTHNSKQKQLDMDRNYRDYAGLTLAKGGYVRTGITTIDKATSDLVPVAKLMLMTLFEPVVAKAVGYDCASLTDKEISGIIDDMLIALKDIGKKTTHQIAAELQEF